MGDVQADMEGPGPTQRGAKYDDLLCTPMDTSAEAETFERATVSYENKGGRFLLTGPRNFQRQYAQLYFCRLSPGGGAAAAAVATKAVLEPVADMDMAITELAAALPVDVLPGPDDPANVSLPQQPLHACLFPGAAPYASFVRATNPHECELGGVRLLATSGQNIEDMAKYTEGVDRLDLMESTLRWRHLAPTAPDTLTCYPFTDDDPFVLGGGGGGGGGASGSGGGACPHAYIVGNQPEFATRLVTGEDGQVVRLVAVPSFAATGALVLLNLRTLQCQLMTFGAYRGAE